MQLAIVALFVVLCCHYVTAAAGPGGLISAEPFFKPHVPFSATMAGAAIAAYSYLGFDAVSTLTEETIAPEKTMPRAIVLIALIGGAIFVIAVYTVQLAHPGAVFKDPDCGYLAAGEPRENRAGIGCAVVRAGVVLSGLDHALFPPGTARSRGLRPPLALVLAPVCQRRSEA